MGLVDAFSPEARVELTVNELIGYFRNEARIYADNTVMKNGLRANLPASHIRVMIGDLPVDTENKED